MEGVTKPQLSDNCNGGNERIQGGSGRFWRGVVGGFGEEGERTEPSLPDQCRVQSSISKLSNTPTA